VETSSKNFSLLVSLSLYLPHDQDILAADVDNHGAVFVPIILGSDKTTVSVMTGHTEYYPLYMSIGNIHNTVRRGHQNGVIVIAFLSIPHSEFDFD
jgi:Plavaka transposase